MSAVPPRVYLVVATYRRPAMLRRLLESLASEAANLAGVVIVCNSADPETAAVALAASPAPVRLITPPANLGTGGGLAAGMEAVLGTPGATHLWVMDDDACARPGALAAMLAAQDSAGAEVVSPLVTDDRGVIRWFPGPLSQPAWDLVRKGSTPEALRAACGPAPLAWNWATWASLLVTCRAVAAVGLPRSDFWYQATDIEYTLRLSAAFRCVLAPAAECPHLPPPESPAQRRLKDRWSLQNNAFLGARLTHGRRVLRHLPGNHFRHWRRYGGLGGLVESVGAFWRGAVLGLPVGLDEYHVLYRKRGYAFEPESRA